MSSAEHRQRGYTFPEVMIVMGILSMLSLVVERTLSAAHETERYMSGIRRVTERAERVAFGLRSVVTSSRKLFQDDATGRGYFEALDLYDPTPPIDTLRLPRFDETRGLGPDLPGDPRTGNALLFVREADAAPVVADPATGKLRYIDTYRFVCIYVAETKRSLIEEPSPRPARDLIFWRSLAFPSHEQIAGIDDADERASVVADLYERFGYDHCWNPGQPVESAFFALRPDGTLGSDPEPIRIELDPDLAERGKLVHANMQLAHTEPDSHPRRAIFTQDDPAAWVPGGFEVKICGPSSARKVWIHLVVEAQTSKGRDVAQPTTVIANTRDL